MAIGYPVALDASADDLDTLGFTSMTAYSKLSGFRANWQLQPPSMPIADMILRADVLNISYSLSARVRVGATTMESPVWMPTGSKFSMEQMAMTLPRESLMVSNSISFQPEMHFSTRI